MKLDCEKELPEEGWFKVTYGPTLKSLVDLFEYLPRMTEHQFSHHALEGRNDFEKWICDVYPDEELCTKIKKARSRERLFEVIGDFLGECHLGKDVTLGDGLTQKIVRADKCFLLKKGPAICSLKAFKRYLPKMTEDQFHYHVNSRKNDFAQWAKDVYADKDLTKAFERSKTLEELRSNVEPFFTESENSNEVEKSEKTPEKKTENPPTENQEKKEEPVAENKEKPNPDEKLETPPPVDENSREESKETPKPDEEQPPEKKVEEGTPEKSGAEKSPEETEKNELLEKIKKAEALAKEDQDVLPKSEKIMDDKVFEDYHSQYEDKNEKMADRFDDIAKRLKESLKDEPDEAEEKMVDDLRTQYEELRQQISEHRKKGKDMFIASLTLRRFEGKLSIDRVTHKKEDFEKAEVVIKEAEKEMKEGLGKTEVDIKKDVMMMAGIKVEKAEE